MNIDKLVINLKKKNKKQKYFHNYFQNNVKNIKNAWKGIKSIISLKVKDTESPKIIKTKYGKTNQSKKKLIMTLSYFKTIYQSHAMIHLLKPLVLKMRLLRLYQNVIIIKLQVLTVSI